jgi:hypothetical protein
VPIAALPDAKSAGIAPAAALWETIDMIVNWLGRIGFGRSVRKITV